MQPVPNYISVRVIRRDDQLFTVQGPNETRDKAIITLHGKVIEYKKWEDEEGRIHIQTPFDFFRHVEKGIEFMLCLRPIEHPDELREELARLEHNRADLEGRINQLRLQIVLAEKGNI